MDFGIKFNELQNDFKDKIQQLLDNLNKTLENKLFTENYYDIPKHKYVKNNPIIHINNITEITELNITMIYNKNKHLPQKGDINELKYYDTYLND